MKVEVIQGYRAQSTTGSTNKLIRAGNWIELLEPNSEHQNELRLARYKNCTFWIPSSYLRFPHQATATQPSQAYGVHDPFQEQTRRTDPHSPYHHGDECRYPVDSNGFLGEIMGGQAPPSPTVPRNNTSSKAAGTQDHPNLPPGVIRIVSTPAPSGGGRWSRFPKLRSVRNRKRVTASNNQEFTLPSVRITSVE